MDEDLKETQSSREIIKEKLRRNFDGKIVRKDLTKKIKEGANVPVYVLEFLLGQYCSSDDEDIIEQGIETVKKILADNYVRPDEAQKVLSKLRQHGSHTIIDMVTVDLNLRYDEYETGKLTCTGLGSDRGAKEATNTAFNFLKANANRISGSISMSSKDYNINYQDLQGIGITEKLALSTVISICSIALNKPTQSSLAVLGEISIAGSLIKVDELANALQVCLDSGAKKILLPITSAADMGTVPPELMGSFQIIFYQSAEDAVFKALGVE